MAYTQKQIHDALESRANITGIDIETIEDSFIAHMAHETAERVDFKDQEIFNSFLDETLKIGREQHQTA